MLCRHDTLVPNCLQLWPAKLVYAIARLAHASGHVHFHPHVQVNAISSSEGERADGSGAQGEVLNVVQTSKGEVRARAVVVALNGWCSEVLPRLAEALRPVKNQVVTTRPAPQLFECGISFGDGSAELYAIQRPDGRIVLGGSRFLAPNEAMGDANDDDTDPAVLEPAVSAALRSFLGSTFPSAALEVEAEWAGVLGFTVDGKPLVGELPATLHSGSRVLIGAGYCGHGMPYCFAVGRHLVELIRGGDSVTEPYLHELTPSRLIR